MCGVFGIVSKKQYSKNNMKKLINKMSNRGPDDSGFKQYKIENKYVYLGHRRLSIIDLSKKGQQPMCVFGKLIIQRMATKNTEVFC